MPRKTKELEKNEEIKTTKKVSTTKKTTKTATKKTTAKKATKTTTKKATTKSATTKKDVKTKSKTSAKIATKKTSKKVKETKITPVEYYDLPYNYNKTVVKLLAQTPNTLFVYWEISEKDRENYRKTYGDNFFETTKPILKIYNDTMNYSFEIDINDFANSWYIHVNDSNCDYRIELGRRFINNDNYIYISNSNEIESPNDKVLFDQIETTVSFRNIKTNKETKKDISTLKFINDMSKIYSIYDLYKEIYKNENIDELSNPSSNYKGDK